jgi:hypothetical protein
VIITDNKIPDGTGNAEVYFKLLYKLNSGYTQILPNSPLGITRSDQQFVYNLKFIGESKAIEIHDKYEMICGKRMVCENFGAEKVFNYKN